MEAEGMDRSQLPPHDTSSRASLLRFAKKNKLLSTSVIFLAVALLAGAILGVFLIWRSVVTPTDTLLQKNDPILLVYGDEKPKEIAYDEWVVDGIFYVDLWDIAERLELTVSGTRNRLRFTSDTDSYLLLEHGDIYAIINGKRVIMESAPALGGEIRSVPAILSEEKALVPYSFLKDAVLDGFALKLDSKTNTLKIRRIMNVTGNDKANATPSSVLFSPDSFREVIFPMDHEEIEYTYTYPIDVSDCLDQILSEHLILANKTHALSSDHVPEALTTLRCPVAENRSFELSEDAAIALEAMMRAMEADGIEDVYVTSAYRTYAYQQTLYEGYVKKHMSQGMSRAEAEREASTYSSRPGESEHQTGLCIDFTSKSMHGQLNEAFENTAAFTWLSENAYQYGFILRYPKSDEQIAITGYDYEPWHYRFVGRFAATEIHMGGLTLEEYLGEG
jgi:D-alanyl-D-alanine carboxypeptidase